MTLSDRLAAAAAERAQAQQAGTSVEDLRRRQAFSGPLLDETAIPEPVIIIAGSTTVAAVEPDPAANPRSICPTCGRTGEIGIVDLPGRMADWVCNACGTMWRLPLPAAPV
jgi:hypothetical protein